MSFEPDLRTRLKDDATVAGIVGTKIDWDVRPQRNALPALVLETVVGNHSQHMEGFNTFLDTIVQFNCFATTKAAAVALREAVLDAIAPEAYEGETWFLRATDITRRQRPQNTEAGFVHHEIVEARIWHGEIPS